MASDSGNGGGNSSQFLTSGSSALILAFLAIGLFVGGLLVMFAMRRYVVLSRRRAGVWEPAGAGPWNWEDTTYGMEPLFTITVGRSLQRRQERGFGARPELLDVHAVKAASDSWEDIMPVSVTEVVEHTPSVPELSAREQHDTDRTEAVDVLPVHASSGYLRPFAIGVHDFVTQIRPSRRRTSPSSSPSLSPAPSTSLSPSSPPPPAPESSTMSTSAGASAPYLRVVLAIAMPTQQRCTSGVPQYALGISDVKWNGEPAEDL